jgi:hypothetical protein
MPVPSLNVSSVPLIFFPRLASGPQHFGGRIPEEVAGLVSDFPEAMTNITSVVSVNEKTGSAFQADRASR